MNKERLKKCRYYHGEEEPPDLRGRGCLFWNAEKEWADNDTPNDDKKAVDFLHLYRLSDEWLNDLYRKYAKVSPVVMGYLLILLQKHAFDSSDTYADFLPVVLDEYVSQAGLT